MGEYSQWNWEHDFELPQHGIISSTIHSHSSSLSCSSSHSPFHNPNQGNLKTHNPLHISWKFLYIIPALTSNQRFLFWMFWLKNLWGRRVLIQLRVKCLTEPSRDLEAEAEAETTTSSSSSSSPLSSSSDSSGISTYSWCAGLGGIGLVETSYLTYLKLTNSDAFCPIGGGTCGDILNSDYASVFGIHLV